MRITTPRRQNFLRLTAKLLVPVLICCGWLSAHAAEPANPKTNPRARAVLDYFYSLGSRTNKNIVSGQFSDFGNGANLRIMTNIFQKTGQWPALIGVDYADFGRGSLTYKTPNKVAIEYWKAGGLVSVMAHMYNPANPKGGGLRDKGVELSDLLKEDSETHKRWMQELDLMAEGLQELKDAGVVVLWRPFHEMNGGWFWWGAKDPETFIRVWRHMFEYFTNTKGLDNLLWVYGPNHGPKTASYYAGDKFVDMVGLDAYTDFVDPQHIKGYQEIAALPKPFGFTEYGPHGSQNPPGNYDYRRFLEGVKQHFPKTCLFMSWNAKWALSSNQYTREMLNDAAIVNRDDLPKQEAGFIPLFNGTNLSGWHIKCQAADTNKTFWTVDNGTVLCDSMGRGKHNYVWLLTDQEYGDFELRLEFQAYKSSPGNSGLQFRSRFDDTANGGWLDGPQVDIHPPREMTWRTGLIYDETREERRWVSPSLKDWNIDSKHKPKEHIFKYGEDGDAWNQLTLICTSNHVKTVLNGLVVTDWDGTGVLDNAAHVRHQVGRSGRFALQLHASDQLKIRFRNIRVRPL